MSSIGSPANLCILLVDDDPDQRMTVNRLLVQRGYTNVTEAGDAEAAMERAAAIHPDLILLDLAMPGRSGADVMPDLRSTAPDALIVVLSNLPRHRLLDPMMRRGAVGFVEKSVSPARLVDEILIAAALTQIARTHVLSLSSKAGSVGVARNFARERLGETDREMVADVELLVSELITNVVLHTNTEPRLEIHVLEDGVRVEVYDDDPALPTIRQPDIDGPGGRGLGLIASLSSQWGAERVGAGKMVWFRIDHRDVQVDESDH